MGLDRSTYLRQRHGATVTWRPFDLHPEIPDGGVPTERLGRYLGHLDRVMAEAAAVGMPMQRPPLVPRTRDALEATEHVRAVAPEVVDTFHHAVMTAYWVDGQDIGDRGVLAAIAAGVDVDPAGLVAALEVGTHAAEVDSSKQEAFDVGAGATPSWWIDRRFVLPGCQPYDVFDRVIDRLG